MQKTVVRVGVAAAVAVAFVFVVGSGASARGAPAGGAPGSALTAVWPIAAPHDVVRSFAAPATRYGAGHRGIDLRAAVGAPVFAMADGVVSFSGVVVDRPLVSIIHGSGYISTVEPVEPTVTAGQSVLAGQQIGVVTAWPHCDEPCLHLGLRRDGLYISPLLVLGGLQRAVLLPHAPG